MSNRRVFAENLVGAGFLYSVSYINQSQPTKKYLLWEKVAKMPLLTYFFLGLGWPWLGEFVGFIVILICFPSRHSLVNRKHRIQWMTHVVLGSSSAAMGDSRNV